MTTIILVAIGILLAAVAALFAIFYGGNAFNGGDVKAQADTLENAGLNIESAQRGYVAANGSYATTLSLLENTGGDAWLKAEPQVQRATAAKQAISTDSGPLAYTVGGVSEIVCRRVNFDYGQADAKTAALATSMPATARGCFASGKDFVYYVRFDGATAAASGTGSTSGSSATPTPTPTPTPPQLLATSIVVHAGLNSACIQIAELEAYSGDTNVALASNGGVASGSTPYSPQAAPANANDGVKPAGYPNIYHSQCGSDDYLRIDFANPSNIDKVVIYGRQDFGQNRDRYSYQIFNGSTLVYQGIIDATSGSGTASPMPEAAGTPEPTVPVTASPLSVYATYMSWLTSEFKRRYDAFGPDVAVAFVTSKSAPFVNGGGFGSHITGVHYAYDGYYSNKGFSNPVPYFYYTLLGDDQPYNEFCQEWKAVAPSPDNYCDNYYGNHITFYPNG